MLSASGEQNAGRIRLHLKQIMIEKVGVFRDEPALKEALLGIRVLRSRFNDIRLTYRGLKYNLDLCRALELEHKLELAETIALGALHRAESRGGHHRVDYPERDDDQWLRHTLAWREEDGSARLDSKPVTITLYQPEARTY
jgi:succinate dehydrogenase / fumarate reductase flavoprotein subunit